MAIFGLFFEANVLIGGGAKELAASAPPEITPSAIYCSNISSNIRDAID